jgi:hypothetical protein
MRSAITETSAAEAASGSTSPRYLSNYRNGSDQTVRDRFLGEGDIQLKRVKIVNSIR